jgi:trigger factor
MRATSNGEAVPEWTMESAGVRIGDGLILKEFDEQLIGMKMGEEKNFSLEFPGQYPLPKVAGKKLDFQVKIKEIMGPKKPVLDDELAKKAGPFQTLEALKQQVKTDLEKKAAETNRYLTGQEVIKKLAEAVGLVVPEAMIRRRVEFLKNNFEADLGRSAVKLAEYLKYLGKSEADFLEDFKKQALVELRTELILTEVARFEKMVVTQEEIAQEINLMALDSGQDPVQLNQGLDEKNINDIKNYIILKKSTDYLVGNAEVKYVD